LTNLGSAQERLSSGLAKGSQFILKQAVNVGQNTFDFLILIISLVDNCLRPILVGKDTRVPDYVVLFSALGGIAVFGINGFVLGPVIAALFIAAWDIFTASE